MKAERAQLLDAIESVADGGEVDWDALEAGLKDEQDRRLFAQLKVLARIADVHRSQADEPDDHIIPTRNPNSKIIGEIRPQAVASTSTGLASSLTSATAPPGARLSRMWGHLELLARIGEGTFGEVYRARDTKLQRDVAVKLLRAGGGPDDRRADTMLRDARILARLRHPNVVLVHGAEAADGRVGLWMELIRGATLEQLIQSRGAYSAREATVIGQDLCRALAAVHDAGLVHRDVKAQNVMREEGGRLVLMDFGAGPLPRGGRPSGLDARITDTLLYLAPEVLAGGDATVRSDIYSLGVLLYHLVSASYPLPARSIDELREAHRTATRVWLHDARPDLQGGLVEVIERALAANPADRFGSAEEMQSALTLALGVGVAGGGIFQARERIEPLMAAPAKPSASRQISGVVAARPGWILIGAFCALAIIAGVTAAWLLTSNGWRPFATTAPGSTQQTIAVLPIQSGGANPDPLFIEVQEALISALGRISSLRTIARASVMRYAGGGKLMPEIGRELNADYIIETTASHEGDRVRMTARLVRAGDDAQLWAQTIERPLNEALRLGGTALEIAGVIGGRPTAEERNDLIAEYTPDSAAQGAYLDGRYQLARGNEEGTRAARGLLEQAIRLDPKYARAHASLARCYMALRVYGLTDADAQPLVMAASRRAVAEDDRSSEAHAVLAWASFLYNRDWKRADSEFRRAVQLNASDVEVRTNYANFLSARGELEEAKRHVAVAREGSPLSGDVWGLDGLLHYYSREYDEAELSYRRGLELMPSVGRYMGLGRVLTEKHDCTGAAQALEQAERSASQPIYRAELARIHAVCGRVAEARELLGELESQFTTPDVPHVTPQHLAYVYTALGNKDRAFELLTQAVEADESAILWAKVDPRLDPLRSDPRFRTYLRAIGADE